MYSNYKSTIGLEIHLQLLLENKMFCPEKFKYGALTNTQTSPITIGCPGTLPKFNKNAITSAIRLGLSCNCQITNLNYFDRKNYFYPDLPKGYQITQDKTPICQNGRIYYDYNNQENYINLKRIHIEEDTANVKIDKSDNNNNRIYNNNGEKINIDYNRCGVALLEIVTEPEFNSGDEVFFFLHELRRLVRFLKISNCNMEEGSLRCDVNISLSETNDKLGDRVEIKNINSIKNVKNAIEYEIKRQSEILNNNNKVRTETRMFVPETNTTKFMRLKENTSDYHYIREYNIKPIYVSNNEIENIKKKLPILPREYKKILLNKYKLSEYVANIFLEDAELLHYFEYLCQDFEHYETVANWIIGPIKNILNEYKITISELNIEKNKLCELITLVINNTISYSAASQIVLKKLITDKSKSIKELISELNITQNSDHEYIEQIVNNILSKHSQKVQEYKNGKTGLLGMFVGEVMRESKYKANPKIANEIIVKTIKEKY